MRAQSRCTLSGAMVLFVTIAVLMLGLPHRASAEGKDKSAGSGSRETSSRHRPPSGPRMDVVIRSPVVIDSKTAATRTKRPPPGRGHPPPRRPGSPPAANNRIDMPPPSENRFLQDEVVLEFAVDQTPQDIAALVARHQIVEIESVNLG